MSKSSRQTEITPPTASTRLAIALAALVLLLAAAARYFSGGDGLWLDEIWTLTLAFSPKVTSPWDILTGMHQENNHYLNTFCVWLLGPQSDWMLYRLPPMIAGTASVAIAGLIGRRRSDVAALLAMLLVGASYVLIHYSSEARGYSFAVCFSLLCLDCQERVLSGARWPAVAGTAASAIAGVLSQPVFLAFYGALLVWSAGKITLMIQARRKGRWRSLQQCGLCHIPPLVFFAWLYAVDLRRVFNAGGPVYPLTEVVLQTFSLAGGGPDGAGQTAGAILVILTFIVSLAILWRVDRGWCVLALLAIVVMPALLLIATGRREVYPRYFVIPITLLNVTFAFGLAAVWKSGTALPRLMGGVLLAASLIGNGIHVARLLEFGRGGNLQTVQFLDEHTAGREISVGSDFDFRNRMVLLFYSQYLSDPRRLHYYLQNQWPARGPEWLLVHNLDRRFKPAPDLTDDAGRRYHLARFYPYAGLSGWCWAVYRNERPP
ncbi:MAG TPA: hypothetical protein VL475_00395, partial [Planctomycetaceae bacterium]|nr:hypothetical protein [Planctomycetaceae bacterium]